MQNLWLIKRRVALLIAIAFITVSIGCRKSPPRFSDYFIFGSTTGCQGCGELYLLSKGRLYPDNVNAIDPGRRTTFSKQALDDASFQAAVPLQNNFPEFLLARPQDRYGCPSCNDAPAYYLELKSEENVRRWYLDGDENSLPLELRAYVKELKLTMERLKQ